MLVNVSNVNGFVDNTPMLGYNLGGNILYHLSKNISLKAGLEFSFNRYYIRAYNSGSPQTSVALSSYFGYVADSLNASVQNTGTDKNPQHFQNRYYQLSLPVGVEMKVAGNGKVQLHIGASLQPSYLLNTDAYVLSQDFKGYVKDPQAFRRWNLNAGAEAFVSYSVGNIRWELGPQIRYQFFSTYKNSYPLQENMLNYGIRIGISKTIR
jgi:Outer membrane protein beta-barrel domain